MIPIGDHLPFAPTVIIVQVLSDLSELAHKSSDSNASPDLQMSLPVPHPTSPPPAIHDVTQLELRRAVRPPLSRASGQQAV